MHKLTTLRRDVVHTVREVVNVVSKYGGGAALPEPARDAMKGFILKLPKKVGEAMRMGAPPSDTPADLGTPGSSTGADSVAAAAAGRAGSERRATASRRGRGDRGVGSSLSASQSPATSTTNSPASSPRIHSSRMLQLSNGDDQGASGSGSGRHMAQQHTMSAGMAFVAAQRVLTLATESLDMMHGVTGVVRESLDRADAWVERLKMVGVQRGDGASEGQPQAESGSASDNRGRMNLNFSPNMTQYRDQEPDPVLLSPLSMSLNLGRSRRGSIGSSAGYSLPPISGVNEYSGSSNYPPGPNTSSYGTSSLPGDAPSPEFGLGLRTMSIPGNEETVKKESEEAKMEVDE
ncbi:hypothetical protein GYMLUDRAFT_237875 [Collybiopsis luxurians FD-317 M1]|nr:hypothetical protein GYMLUDRAFT_237875 [Collybiopsis luxurians FD-317 M1]